MLRTIYRHNSSAQYSLTARKEALWLLTGVLSSASSKCSTDTSSYSQANSQRCGQKPPVTKCADIYSQPLSST